MEKLKGINRGSKNGQWKGNKKIHMSSLHAWVINNINRPKICEECGTTKNIDLANKGIYNRDFSNWRYLCRKHHMLSDGRIDRFIKSATNRVKGEKHHFYGKPELNPMYGRVHSLETREKMSKALKGRTAWNKGLKGGIYV